MGFTERFDSALQWSSLKHRDQERKGTSIPYVSHLLAVSSLVMEHGGDEDQAIAALLHDAIEDQGVTDAEIDERYGKRVAEIVRACTDTDTVPKPPWRERKRAYIDHLADAPTDALLVSLADKTHNARCIATDVARDGEDYFTRFSGGVSGTRWYYRRLFDAFMTRAHDLPADQAGRPGASALLAEYERVIEAFGATPEAAIEYEATSA